MSSWSLEEQSFINIVNYFKDELIEVMNGTPATEVFTENTRSTLRDRKVIDYRKGFWFLTKRATEILQSK